MAKSLAVTCPIYDSIQLHTENHIREYSHFPYQYPNCYRPAFSALVYDEHSGAPAAPTAHPRGASAMYREAHSETTQGTRSPARRPPCVAARAPPGWGAPARGLRSARPSAPLRPP